MSTATHRYSGVHPGTALDKLLLVCGILSSLLYTAMNIFVPLRFDGYSQASQTVSELSAIGAPTRQLWMWLGAAYILLLMAFAGGVWRSSAGNRPLRIAAVLMFIYCLVNFYWPPMHLRGNEPTLTDTLHIVWAMIAILFMMSMMGFGAAAFGKAFRLYTIASLAMYVVFGYLMGLQAPNIPVDGPTPTIGLYERIMIGVFLLWIMVLAIILLKKISRQHTAGTHS